jgi:hypothetical protein
MALLYQRQLIALLQAAVAAAEAQKLQPCIFMLDLLLPELQKMGKHLVPPTSTITLSAPGQPQGSSGFRGGGSQAEPPKQQHIFHESMEARLCLLAALAWRGQGPKAEGSAEPQQQQGHEEGASSPGGKMQHGTQPGAAAAAGGGEGTVGAKGSETSGVGGSGGSAARVGGGSLLESPVALELLQWCWDMVFVQGGGYPVSIGTYQGAPTTYNVVSFGLAVA